MPSHLRQDDFLVGERALVDEKTAGESSSQKVSDDPPASRKSSQSIISKAYAAGKKRKAGTPIELDVHKKSPNIRKDGGENVAASSEAISAASFGDREAKGEGEEVIASPRSTRRRRASAKAREDVNTIFDPVVRCSAGIYANATADLSDGSDFSDLETGGGGGGAGGGAGGGGGDDVGGYGLSTYSGNRTYSRARMRRDKHSHTLHQSHISSRKGSLSDGDANGSANRQLEGLFPEKALWRWPSDLVQPLTMWQEDILHQCPFPGCNGAGHTSAKYGMHKVLNGCPLFRNFRRLAIESNRYVQAHTKIAHENMLYGEDGQNY